MKNILENFYLYILLRYEIICANSIRSYGHSTRVGNTSFMHWIIEFFRLKQSRRIRKLTGTVFWLERLQFMVQGFLISSLSVYEKWGEIISQKNY